VLRRPIGPLEYVEGDNKLRGSPHSMPRLMLSWWLLFVTPMLPFELIKPLTGSANFRPPFFVAIT